MQRDIKKDLKRKAAALGISSGAAFASMSAAKRSRSMGLSSNAIANRSGPSTAAGAPRKVWLHYTTSINCTEAIPGFKAYQFKANDPYRPDPLNNLSPNGWSQYGGIYNYAKVIGAKMEVKSWMYDANNSDVNSISWGDKNYTPAIGAATASGYSYPSFNIKNSIGMRIAGPSGNGWTTFRTPFIRTDSVVKDSDEAQHATTVAGGGAASPTSLWYFHVLTQPVVAAANKNLLVVRLSQLVEFYDSTDL